MAKSTSARTYLRHTTPKLRTNVTKSGKCDVASTSSALTTKFLRALRSKPTTNAPREFKRRDDKEMTAPRRHFALAPALTQRLRARQKDDDDASAADDDADESRTVATRVVKRDGDDDDDDDDDGGPKTPVEVARVSSNLRLLFAFHRPVFPVAEAEMIDCEHGTHLLSK